MATVDKLVVELRADTVNFTRGMNSAGKTTADFSVLAGRAKIAALAIGAALYSVGAKALDAAGHLQDLSMESGIAASTLSALNSPLQQSGSSVDEFTSSVVKMNRAISDAASGDNKQLSATFNELGLSINELRSMSPEKQLDAITTALAKVKDQGDLTRLGVSIFGRSFSALIPIIKETNGNLAEYARQAQEAGNALTDEQIKKLDDFGDALTRAGIGLQNVIGGAFADFLLWLDAMNAKVDYAIANASEAQKLQANRAGLGATFAGAYAQAGMTKKEIQGAPIPPDFKPAEKEKEAKRVYNAISSGAKSAKSDVDRLQESLDDMWRETSRDVYTSGMNDLSKKLSAVDFQINELTRKYGKLTPEQQKQVETIKANVTEFDRLQKMQIESERLAESMGGAFNDAFMQGIDGASSFSDVLGSLGEQIKKVLFTQIVANPLQDLVTGAVKTSGIGDIFGSILGGARAEGGAVQAGIPYMVGEKRPEIFVPQTSGRIIPNVNGAAGGVGGVQINVINNSSAKVSAQSSQNSSGGMDIKLMIDEAVASNIGSRGSKTSQALSAYNSQALVRR